jgi:hypothetical protein
MRIMAAAVATLAAAALPAQDHGGVSAAPGKGPRIVKDSVIAPGVTWRRIVDPAGPWDIHLATVDLRRDRFELRHVRAKDSLVAREKTSAMVARQPDAARVVVAINGDFFNVRTGENENAQVIAGEWWKGMRGSDSPYDAFAAVRTYFALDPRGKPMMDRFVLDASVIHASGTLPLLAVNFLPKGGPETVALFTDRMGAVPADTARTPANAPLAPAGRRGDTTLYVVSAAVSKAVGNLIPPGTAALVGYGPRGKTIQAFAAGDTVRIVMRAAGHRGDGPVITPQLLIGGWPRILAGGVNVALRSAWDEGTLSSNAEVRHPRSAIGFSRDSSRLYIAAVDGRQAASAGMTLAELADLLRAEGAWDALNFDGGGSTALVVNGTVVNSPSDATGERPVGNALLVIAKPR